MRDGLDGEDVDEVRKALNLKYENIYQRKESSLLPSPVSGFED